MLFSLLLETKSQSSECCDRILVLLFKMLVLVKKTSWLLGKGVTNRAVQLRRAHSATPPLSVGRRAMGEHPS